MPELMSPADGAGVGVEGGHDPSATVVVSLGSDDDGGVFRGLPEPEQGKNPF